MNLIRIEGIHNRIDLCLPICDWHDVGNILHDCAEIGRPYCNHDGECHSIQHLMAKVLTNFVTYLLVLRAG